MGNNKDFKSENSGLCKVRAIELLCSWQAPGETEAGRKGKSASCCSHKLCMDSALSETPSNKNPVELATWLGRGISFRIVVETKMAVHAVNDGQNTFSQNFAAKEMIGKEGAIWSCSEGALQNKLVHNIDKFLDVGFLCCSLPENHSTHVERCDEFAGHTVLQILQFLCRFRFRFGSASRFFV